jgi:cyclophilin family peptidyl-prolyl cis-trans isomerase
MARAQDPNSAGSQFFIVLKDANFLDGQYTVFGRVTSGMDAVDKIAALNRDAADAPVDAEQARMVKVTISD